MNFLKKVLRGQSDSTVPKILALYRANLDLIPDIPEHGARAIPECKAIATNKRNKIKPNKKVAFRNHH